VGGRCRTAIGINCDEDAVRQRVQCRACKRYFCLPPLETIEAKPGRPKVSRSVCECGSTDLQRCGWHFDGRQRARCNACHKEFNLPPGILAPGKSTDTLGRRIHYSDGQEHEFQLPSAAEEAAALVQLFESGQCDIEEIRVLIRVTDDERRCLEFLACAGMLAATNVQKAMEFRDRVLEIFDGLIDAELAILADANPLPPASEDFNNLVAGVVPAESESCLNSRQVKSD
jgi:hypothetical protein